MNHLYYASCFISAANRWSFGAVTFQSKNAPLKETDFIEIRDYVMDKESADAVVIMSAQEIDYPDESDTVPEDDEPTVESELPVSGEEATE